MASHIAAVRRVISPFSRPRPDIDDTLTSDKLRKMDQRFREYAARCKVEGRECWPRIRGPNGALSKSPYPSALRDNLVACDISDSVCDSATEKGRNAVEIERIERGYEGDEESGESLAEDEDGWMVVDKASKNDVGTRKMEEENGAEEQDHTNPFADPSGDSEVESCSSVATSKLGRVMEIPDLHDPFADSSYTGSKYSSASSASSVVLPPNSEDTLGDLALPN